MPWQRQYNPFVIALLRSSLHRFMSGSTPVNYLRDGDTLLVVSSCEHIWWKNLRGGAPVAVRVRR
jgi:nitroimidazol reductase NimA-like FMN-containing flavoprotein (pyridoxamine 5'-phosphate oxidase superfamily)